MDGAFAKVFCKLHDPEFPPRLLPPYSGLKPETYERIAALVRGKPCRPWPPVSANITDLMKRCHLSDGLISTRVAEHFKLFVK
jgi:hypothetical protein